MTKEEQKKEALKRLNLLKEKGMKFHKPVIDCFKKGDVPIFENQGMPFRSVFYYLYGNQGQDPYDEIIRYKEEFEKEYHCLVYLILITHSQFGTLYDMLYVSRNEEEWEMDIDELKQGYSYVNCVNASDPMLSEIGEIGFKYDSVCGGIYRSA